MLNFFIAKKIHFYSKLKYSHKSNIYYIFLGDHLHIYMVLSCFLLIMNAEAFNFRASDRFAMND